MMFAWFKRKRKEEVIHSQPTIGETVQKNELILPEQLKEMLPMNRFINDWCVALNKVLPEYEIDTTERIAMFVAQCGHESSDFRVLKENLNYRWETLRKVFPKYFPTDALAQEYASKPNKQEAIANRVYASRMGNGPEKSGDGFRYSGKGLIQLTGKNNYTAFAESVNMPLSEIGDYLLTFEGAVKSACWFWKENNLNPLSDQLDVRKATRRINGGFHGLEDRQNRFNRNMNILK
jgi:putative chitinase